MSISELVVHFLACSSTPFLFCVVQLAQFDVQYRLHSIILASCKPGQKPGRKQVESMSKASCELALNGFFFYSPFD